MVSSADSVISHLPVCLSHKLFIGLSMYVAKLGHSVLIERGFSIYDIDYICCVSHQYCIATWLIEDLPHCAHCRLASRPLSCTHLQVSHFSPDVTLVISIAAFPAILLRTSQRPMGRRPGFFSRRQAVRRRGHYTFHLPFFRTEPL